MYGAIDQNSRVKVDGYQRYHRPKTNDYLIPPPGFKTRARASHLSALAHKVAPRVKSVVKRVVSSVPWAVLRSTCC